jgi:hypothetical protein
MTDDRVLSLAGEQYNRVSREQLEALGLSPDAIAHRLAIGRLAIDREGVFAIPPVLGYDDCGRWIGATLTSPDTFLHRVSAACLFGVLSFEPGLTVVRPGSGGPRWLCGMRVHRSSTLEGETTTFRRIRVTTIERTLVDLACCVGDDALARALRESVRLKRTTLYALWDYLRPRLHRRGARRLARAVARYSDLPLERARSGAEIRALEILREAGIQLPELNIEIAGEEADLSWEARKLIIEIDGGPFHLDKGEDARKEGIWRAAGWEVCRIPSNDIYQRPRKLLASAANVQR